MAIFDEKNEEKVSQTPTLTELFKNALDNLSGELRVSMPAEVIRYDHTKQLVDVKPYLLRKYRDGNVEDAPIIYNVPVAFPRAGEAFIVMPLAVGHSVLLVFADRSLEKWLTAGKRTTPDDARKHAISDAVAIPGCYPFSNPAKVNNPKDVILKNKSLEMRLKPNGHIQVLNDSDELMKTIDAFMRSSISGWHWGMVRAWRRFRTFLEK